MPGTGDVIYVLGPSLVALALGVVILVVVRTLRRGPAVARRSAPDHGLAQPEEPEAASGTAGHRRPSVPQQRSAEDWGTVTRAADGRRLAVRPSDAVRARAMARRAFTGR